MLFLCDLVLLETKPGRGEIANGTGGAKKYNLLEVHKVRGNTNETKVYQMFKL